jgi:hypothetical protein
VANDGDRTLGAVGYIHDERNRSVRINELIARDEAVKGSLLRLAVETADVALGADVVKCDVSAYSPRLQQTLLDMGFLPAGYIPGMVFHNTSRWDVVKMIKLNVPWELNHIELTEPSQIYFDLVAPAFEKAAQARTRKHPASTATVLKGFSPTELEFFHRVAAESTPENGTELASQALHIVIDGSVSVDGQTFGSGSVVGAESLLGGPGIKAVSGGGARLISLSREGLARLGDQYPRLAVKLYQNLAAQR